MELLRFNLCMDNNGNNYYHFYEAYGCHHEWTLGSMPNVSMPGACIQHSTFGAVLYSCTGHLVPYFAAVKNPNVITCLSWKSQSPHIDLSYVNMLDG